MRKAWHRCAAALSLALALLACSGDRGPISPGTMPTAMDLVIVSGSGQEAEVGRMLAEPFVVQVTDDWGRPVRNVEVTWTVVSGDGALRGMWEACPEGQGPGDPVRTVLTSTDGDGFGLGRGSRAGRMRSRSPHEVIRRLRALAGHARSST